MVNTDSAYRPRLGIGSFAFRYAIGFSGFVPRSPMTAMGFLDEAERMGFEGVQICENLGVEFMSAGQLRDLRDRASSLGLFVEIGMRNLTRERLRRHLDILDQVGSDFLRIVLGPNASRPEERPNELCERAVDVLGDALCAMGDDSITMGIENHFDVGTEHLMRIIDTLKDRRIGLILDTTNCLGFIERPQAILEAFRGRVISAHVKDFVVEKIDAGYMVKGAPLGRGWLDSHGLLQELAAHNSVQSLILEMTIRRDESWDMEQVLAWEKESVEISADKLGSLRTEIWGPNSMTRGARK